MLSIFLFASIYITYAAGGMYFLSKGIRSLTFFLFGIFCINNLATAGYLIPQIETLPLRPASVAACTALLLAVGMARRGIFEIESRDKMSYAYALMLVALGIVVVFQSLRSPEPDYAQRKTIQFFLLSVFPTIAISLAGPMSRLDVIALLSGSTLSALGPAVAMMLQPQMFAEFDGRLSVGAEIHPIAVARNVGVGVCLLLTYFMAWKGQQLARFAGLMVAAGCMPALLLTGSRGPVLSATIAVLVSALLTRSPQALIRLAVSAFLMTVIVAVIFTGFLDGAFRSSGLEDMTRPIERMRNLSERIGDNQSDLSRLDRYQVALDGFIDSKFMGIGTGGFPAIWSGPRPGGIFTDKDYPHNFILEVACEQGIFGLTILAAIIFLVARSTWRWIQNPGSSQHNTLLVSLLIYAFLNASISGDLGTNFLIFVVGAIVVRALGHRADEDEEQDSSTEN